VTHAAIDHRPARRPKRGSVTRQALFLVICALGVSLFLKVFVIQFFVVPSRSMEPTLRVGDAIAVTRALTQGSPPHRGDVIVFRDPGGWLPPAARSRSPLAEALRFVGMIPYHPDEHLVKRVVAEAGDVVECRGSGPLYLNGTPVAEPYLVPGARPCAATFTVTVPARSVWVLGDNRDDSADSRFHLHDGHRGSVPLSSVVGTVVVRIWPPSRWGPPAHGEW
jgi:signal peptidase I